MNSVSRMDELKRSALRYFAIGFLLAVAIAGAIRLNAQALGNHNTNAPVNFAADRTELQDRQNRVVLAGNVDITQAGLRLRAARAIIDYTDSGTLQIQRMTATGGVRVTRGNESASGNNAIYDFNRRLITMSGDVRLNRGSDRISGGRLTIDLRSGVSSVDGSASGTSSATGQGNGSGRVTGSFTVPEN